MNILYRDFTRPLRIIVAVVTALVAINSRAQQKGAAVVVFEPNKGQIVDIGGAPHPEILFRAGGAGMTLFLGRDRVGYILARPVDSGREHPRSIDAGGARRQPEPPELSLYRVDMEIVGANLSARIESREPEESWTSYYLPHLPEGTGAIRSYRNVIYHDIYPKIDLVLKGERAAVKYEFVVRPGGDPSRIRLRWSGATDMIENPDGAMRIITPAGEIVDGRPVSFQTDGGRIDEKADTVGTRYERHGDLVGFRPGEYDRTRELVIDPSVTWSTCYGGSYADYSAGNFGSPGVAIGADGSIVFAGYTLAYVYPTTPGVFQPNRAFPLDGTIVKFRRDGTRAWATFFGGLRDEYSGGAVIDRSGNIYVVGSTSSLDLPVTTGAFQTTMAGVDDGFLVKLDSTGGRVWATYFGGSGTDVSNSIALDSAGGVVIAGRTESSDLPTTPGAFQRNIIGTNTAPFIASFSTAGARRWATFFGEGFPDGLAVDPAGDIYLAGQTSSTTFPVTASAYQRTIAGTIDAFVAKLTVGGARIWATYIGGVSIDYPYDVTTDAAGNSYICGYTQSTNYPVTPGAAQRTLTGTYDAIVSSFTPSGAIRWSTYFGGSGLGEALHAIAADAFGNVVATGISSSTILPRSGMRLQTYGGSFDAFVTMYDSTGAQRYSSHIGGSAYDYPSGIAIDGHEVVISGTTYSADFPVTPGAFKGGDPTTADQFLTRICLLTPFIVASGPLQLCHGDSVVLTASGGFSGYRWSTGATTRSIVVRQAGRYSVTSTGDCGGPYDTVTVVQPARRQPIVNTAGITSICPGDTLSAVASPGFRSYRWSTGDTTPGVRIIRAGSYRVMTVDSNGCRDSSEFLTVAQSPLPAPALLTPSGAIRLCLGDTLRVTARQPAGGENFVWSDGTPGRTIAISRAGIYYLSVTGSSGCSIRSDTIRVTMAVPAAARIEAPAGRVFCASDSLPLLAPAGFVSYRWSTSDTTRSIRLRQSGRVAIDMIDSNGCHVCDTIDVTMRPAPRPLLTVDGSLRLCAGQSVELRATPGFVRYSWSDGREGESIRVGTAGRYSVAAIDANGCSGGSDTVTVEQLPQPRADVSGPVVVCPVGSVRYSAVAADGLRYRWSITGGTIKSGDGTPAVDVLWSAAGGTIRLVVEDIASGCSDTVELPVSVSSEVVTRISASRSTRLCPDDSVTLDAGDGYSRYRWSTGETTRSITRRDTGRVWVEVETAGGCNGHSDTITITRNAAPFPEITVDGNRTICAGESVILAATGYASYLWSTGETTESIRVDSSGTYTVSVVDASGCSGVSESVAITVRPEQTIRLDTAAICDGDSVELELPEGYLSYRWATGETTRTLRVDSAGRYAAEMIDSFGCRVHVEPIVVVARSRGEKPRITRNGTELESTPAERYRWYRNGELLAGESGRTLAPHGAGSYVVEAGEGACTMFSDAWELERVAWLDTTAGRVGERLVLHLHLAPELVREEGITRVDAEILFSASALYLHAARALGGGGAPGIVRLEGGHLRLEWSGEAIEGERIFELEFEGLATAVPVNPVALAATVLSGTDTIAVIGEGLILLSGCEIAEGFRFGRAVRIESLHPNPVAGIGELVYRAPSGSHPYLRLRDLSGREITRISLPEATGESERVAMAVEGIASGVYMLELVDRSESATMPFVIRK
jgi:hypothetical protein